MKEMFERELRECSRIKETQFEFALSRAIRVKLLSSYPCSFASIRVFDSE